MKRNPIKFLLLLVLTSCFSVRTPYIPTIYYYLNHEAFSFRNIATIETYILLKEFSVPDELLDNRIVIWYDDGTIQKFNYHRFNTDYSELLNGFIYSRFNQSKAFKYGVASFNTAIVPNYILEGSIIEFKAFASRQDKKKNWVQISFNVNLIKYEPLEQNKKIIHSGNYSQKLEVSERENSIIVQAFSKLFSLMTDKLILDIQSAIAQDLHL
ncbi:MAG: hypothetical protein ACK42Z_08020 [Candidatus Kapaibacteriota bacterium]